MNVIHLSQRTGKTGTCKDISKIPLQRYETKSYLVPSCRLWWWLGLIMSGVELMKLADQILTRLLPFSLISTPLCPAVKKNEAIH